MPNQTKHCVLGTYVFHDYKIKNSVVEIPHANEVLISNFKIFRPIKFSINFHFQASNAIPFQFRSTVKPVKTLNKKEK